MRRESLIVGDHGVRPAGPSDACFYCREKVGTEHHAECVIRRRTVVVRATVTFVTSIPERWTREDAEGFWNEGTWCADNLPEMLREHIGEEDHQCLCEGTTLRVLREATVADEATSAVRVENTLG